MFKAILRFNLQTHFKNIWLFCAVLASTVFVILFAPDVLISERSGLSFIIDFYHKNMIFALLILSYTIQTAQAKRCPLPSIWHAIL